MDNNQYIIRSKDELGAAAAWLIKRAGARRVVAFDAPMGAGKTTLISEMTRLLGSDDAANSPTFSIVNHYDVPGGKPIYHFDFYRIDDSRGVADIGIYDYLDSGSWCLLEWPRVAVDFLPADTVVVRIGVLPDGERVLTVVS